MFWGRYRTRPADLLRLLLPSRPIRHDGLNHPPKGQMYLLKAVERGRSLAQVVPSGSGVPAIGGALLTCVPGAGGAGRTHNSGATSV